MVHVHYEFFFHFSPRHFCSFLAFVCLDIAITLIASGDTDKEKSVGLRLSYFVYKYVKHKLWYCSQKLYLHFVHYGVVWKLGQLCYTNKNGDELAKCIVLTFKMCLVSPSLLQRLKTIIIRFLVIRKQCFWQVYSCLFTFCTENQSKHGFNWQLRRFSLLFWLTTNQIPALIPTRVLIGSQFQK